MSKSMSEELAGRIEKGRPYIIVKENGKEFSVIVDEMGEHVWYGHAALSRVLVLRGTSGNNALEVAVVDGQVANEWTKANEVYFSAHVHIASGFMVTIKVGDISLLEQPWRVFIPSEIVTPEGGVINEPALIAMFLGMKRFQLPGGGFAKNPLLGKVDTSNLKILQLPNMGNGIQVAKEEIESEDR